MYQHKATFCSSKYHLLLSMLGIIRLWDGSLDREITAIDSHVAVSPTAQFKHELFHRDLNKAYIGFVDTTLWAEEDNNNSNNNNNVTLPPLATGNWGCGAFGGDLNLKIIQQLYEKTFYFL
jgi:poly(ADP-ribose) glycohydrolase